MRTAAELLESAQFHLAGNDPWKAVSVLEELVAFKQSPPGVTAKNRDAFAQQLKLVAALAFQGVEVSTHWKELVVHSGSAYTANGAARYEGDVRSTLAEA